MAGGLKPSSFSRTMLNLWIGMCRGVAGLPRDLFDLGYVDRWIDFRFRIATGEIVHPDLIVASGPQRNSLLLEFKSGANVDEEQLRRDALVTPDDLVRAVYIERDAAETHDLVVLALADQIERITIGVDRSGVSLALLCQSADGIALVQGVFSVTDLTRLFSPSMRIPWDRIPTGFVPVDGSSEDWEIAELVGVEMVARMQRREPSFNVEDL